MASSVTIMSTDMYAPSLPDLAEEFNTTATKVKLTISLNLLAYGLAQLVHGPLSDRFGRRPVILTSLTCVIIGCLLCVFSQTIDQLIAARIFLGFVAAAEAVVGLAVIKDLFTEKQQIKAFALFSMVIAIVPAVAPIAGGFVHVYLGWEANFYIIAFMALLAAVCIYRLLPESTVPDPLALQPKQILTAYASLLRNSDFMAHTLLLGIALGLIFVFVTGAPFVLITYLGVPVEEFGFYQAGIVVSFFIGSWVASRLADSWEASRLLNLGVAIILIGAVLLVVQIVIGRFTAVTLSLAYSVMTFGMGPLFAVAPSQALRSVKTNSGSASAMLSGLEQSIAGLSGVAISVLHDDTAKPMAIVTVGFCILLILLSRWINRPLVE